MRTYKRLLIIYCCTLVLFSNFFMCYTMPVFASEGVYDPDTSWWEKFVEESSAYIAYLCCRVGAVVKDFDFAKWVQTREDYKEWWNTGHISRLEDSSGNVSYSFDKELMAYIKQCLDDYAAENQQFVVKPTYKYTDVPASTFRTATDYNKFRSYAYSHDLTYFLYRYDYNGRLGDMYLGDLTEEYKKGGGFIFTSIYQNDFYMSGSDWSGFTLPCMYYVEEKGEDGNISFSEPIEKNLEFKGMGVADFCGYREGLTNFKVSNVNSKVGVLITKDGGRIRVFKSKTAFMDYSAGQRKIYYTSNYYNYVPEDLQVSIDDLQKTIDDMQDVIDKLLDQITNDTSESEIEELLRLILEELKNNQGGGGGGGGGDVNVDIDLSPTNTLLSKILAKVTQIFDKMSETAGNTMDSVVDSIKNLERMLNKYLAAITGDLDDIKGKLDQMTEEEFGEKTDSFLSETMDSFSEIGGVAKTKFPFSLPNDMRLLIERITVKPVETMSLYSDSASQVTPYSGEHGGGGASRPPGGIAYVEQGTAGECFTLSPTGAPLIRCPIVIKSRNIDFSIVIDLSEFDKVATLSRTFLTLLFVYGLLNLTFKVMGLWGDLVE